ncbi:MAG TPA: phosphate acyltransferase [Candidatus Polarisedimenticolaceae bacterium]|nr:phosphate acyltransferase [Candidatus Polarisedimenticolaceae bacterium]
MIRREDALDYHGGARPGKIEIRSTKPCLTPRELRLTYLPGASFPTEEIVKNPAAAFRYTGRGNLVGVITNGTAVPGLGDVGPLAAKPMQEGVAVLFKRLADIDVFDVELDARDPASFVDAVRMLEPTFGGINIKDIGAPDGLYVYDRLVEALNIPVFHENLYSTAVVAVAALLNAVDLTEKRIGEIRVVMCGAGTVGTGCGRLMLRLGVEADNLWVYDVNGLLHPDRDDLHPYQRTFCRDVPARELAEGIRGADVFVGASAGDVLTLEMIRSMGRFPLVLALATPEPEIDYEAARGSRQDVIVATSQGMCPNAVLDLLSFPYIFRGALDVRATRITEEMMLAAARSLAELARDDVPEEVERAYGNQRFTFGPEYLLPKPIDPRILVRESAAVAQRAIEQGVAGSPLGREAHEESLVVRFGTGRETLRRLILRARQNRLRIVFSEGSNETILRACALLLDESIADPVLVGGEREIGEAVDRLGLDLSGITIADPARSPRVEHYVDEYFAMRQRRGVMRHAAERRLRERDYFAAMMVRAGDADMMIAGVSTHYAETLRTIVEMIGTAAGVGRISSHYLILLPSDVVVLADCAVNIDPDPEQLAEIALLAARMTRSLGIEPRVAMLSFSNFGSVRHPAADKVRRATEIARRRAPELMVDGEIQLAAARDAALRSRYFPFSALEQDANVLVFPDLQSGNLALQALQQMGEAVAIGPVLMGTRRPVHVVQYGFSVEDVFNLATVGVVEAGA